MFSIGIGRIIKQTHNWKSFSRDVEGFSRACAITILHRNHLDMALWGCMKKFQVLQKRQWKFTNRWMIYEMSASQFLSIWFCEIWKLNQIQIASVEDYTLNIPGTNQEYLWFSFEMKDHWIKFYDVHL